MVTFTSTLITQQSARHCSASPIACWTLKCQNQNITSISKFLQATNREKILTLSLHLFGPFPFKGTTQESINSIQIFSFFFLFHTIVGYLPHIHITYLLSVWVLVPNFSFWPLSSRWWRYLHHLRRWWRYLHHLRGWLDGYNFLLTITQNKALNQYTLYNSA